MTHHQILINSKLLTYLITAILLAGFSIPTAAKQRESTLRVRLLEDLIHRGDYERSVDELIEIEFNPDISMRTRFASTILQARLFELSQKEETSLRLLQRFLDRESDLVPIDLQRKAIREQVRLHLKLGHVKAATSLSKEFRNNKALVFKTKNEVVKSDYKTSGNPFLYATASAVVPGLGQALQGRSKDTFSSLLMIGIPLFLSLEARKNEEHVTANAASVLAGFFYFGNIASSYKIARLTREKEEKGKWLSYVNTTILPIYSEARKDLGLSIQIDALLK